MDSLASHQPRIPDRCLLRTLPHLFDTTHLIKDHGRGATRRPRQRAARSVGRALDFTEAKVAQWDGDPAGLQQEREQLMAWGENLSAARDWIRSEGRGCAT